MNLNGNMKNLVPTIIIIQELHAEIRGYGLIGREFVLAEHAPRKDKCKTLDGAEITDDYWVIAKCEFMRVVPEAQKYDFDSDFVYIPTFVARMSFRPSYIPPTKKVF